MKPRPLATLGWLVLATAVVLGRRAATPSTASDDLPAAPLAPPGTPAAPAPPPVARHAPVTVTSEWWHPPVEVLATPADTAPAGGLPRWERALPRPLAALRGFASPLIMPRLQLPRILSVDFPVLRGLAARARPGQPVTVTLTAYCISGSTRQGTRTRAGIIAADPRIFPMSRHVHLYAAGRYLGRFRVEDTGAAVRGTRIDIWTPDCADAERFGTRPGVAALAALDE